MTEHILHAYAFDSNAVIPLVEVDISHAVQSDEQLTWLHLDAEHPETKAWLQEEVDYLEPVVIDALLAEETRPRMMQIGDGALLILRGVNLNDNAQPEDMVSIRMWVDQYRIITLRRRKVKAISEINDRLQKGYNPKQVSDFLCLLISKLFDRIQPVLTDLDELTDSAEEQVLEAVDVSLRESVVNVRKQAIMFRRYMAPQRDAIGQLRMSDLTWLGDTEKRQLQENYNQVTRYIEDLDAIRERSQIVKDELANVLADRLNRNMYFLSVIAAIFLPLSFLTGLLGINVGGIPGADNDYAFWIFSGLLALVVFLQIMIFKKLKWF